MPIVGVDDLVIAVTTPRQQPALHCWRTHPVAAHLAADRIVELQVAFAGAMRPPAEAVIGNHLQTATPVVLEGDYRLPGSAVRPAFAGTLAEGQVRAVFLHEPDLDQLVSSYRVREPDAGQQPGRGRSQRLLRRLAGRAGGRRRGARALW